MDVFEVDFQKRLEQDYIKHGSLYVAYDFDNTIYDTHSQGINFNKIIDLIRECKRLKFSLILFTAKEGNDLAVVQKFLKTNSIPYDYVNKSPVMATRKPYYNILLDDRAGLHEAYMSLSNLVNKIENGLI